MAGIVVPVRHEGETGEARRVAVSVAAGLGFSEGARGKVALVATEAARNIAIHAGQGELIVTALDRGGVGGVELLALDKGPGMADVDRCLRDGYSTSGTGGIGLGAIARLADHFDIYSVPGQGTAVLAQLWAGPTPSRLPAERVEVGVVNVPKPGEEVCGDGWSVTTTGLRVHVMVTDGLGHGPGAATAALEAIRVFHQRAGGSPTEMLNAIHGALHPTRGAAVAVAELDLSIHKVRYAGVGNIVSGVLTGERRQNMLSVNGTVGCEMRPVHELTYDWLPGSVMVMHSDGMSTQWRAERYPGLLARRPSLVAGVLYRDFNRGRDDCTVLVMRERAGGDT